MSDFLEIIDGVKEVLLIEPKSALRDKTMKKIYALGLIKIGSYLKKRGVKCEFIQSNGIITSSLNPEVIFVSSLLTYKSSLVKKVVDVCREQYPDAKIVVGGIYASLLPDHCKEYTQCDYVIEGIIDEVEDVKIDFSLIDTEYQIFQLSRGCTKRCKFCLTYKLEPEFECKSTFIKKVVKKKLLFLDNNFLANPHIDKILDELDELKMYGKIQNWEAVSGIDVDYLIKKPELAKRIKRSGCVNIRIAWDGSIKKAPRIKKAIDLLTEAKFKPANISVFMLYNFDVPFEECEKKRVMCYNWGVRVFGCRYIPLDRTEDNYNIRRAQTSEDYYIHPNWTDDEVKKFTMNTRRHFLAIYNKMDFFSKELSRNHIPNSLKKRLQGITYEEAKKEFPDAWNPAEIHLL